MKMVGNALSNSHRFPDAAGADTTMESAFDRHRRNLAMAQAACKDSDSLGWNAELRCYLSVIIENVSRIDRFSLGPIEEGSKRGRDGSRGGRGSS